MMNKSGFGLTEAAFVHCSLSTITRQLRYADKQRILFGIYGRISATPCCRKTFITRWIRPDRALVYAPHQFQGLFPLALLLKRLRFQDAGHR